ncbi:MAG: cell division protein ZapC [Plesiomonas sp.]|uniref:cell division protein ZapC n=1 Tax=Plesiomonas sp. TaxID=2486279 RepID=UPI003F35E1D5
MNIQPNDHWKWYVDSELDRLMLDLANGMIFRSRLTGRVLTPDVFSGISFHVDDIAQYYDYMDGLHASKLSSDQKSELVLNAIAARHFLKPVMPKSWYFERTSHAYSPEIGELVNASLLDSEEKVRLFVVENNGNASLCLFAQHLQLSSGKMVGLGDPIKVMNDRLSPPATLSYSQYAHVS